MPFFFLLNASCMYTCTYKCNNFKRNKASEWSYAGNPKKKKKKFDDFCRSPVFLLYLSIPSGTQKTQTQAQWTTQAIGERERKRESESTVSATADFAFPSINQPTKKKTNTTISVLLERKNVMSQIPKKIPFPFSQFFSKKDYPKKKKKNQLVNEVIIQIKGRKRKKKKKKTGKRTWIIIWILLFYYFI